MIKGFAPQASLWAWVDPGSWRFVQAVVMWGSVNMLGWGGELLSSAMLFAPPSQSDAVDASASMGAGAATNREAGVGRTHIKHGFWKLAQLAFPLFLTIAVYSRSVFGLPFLCAGLWKFGCVCCSTAPPDRTAASLRHSNAFSLPCVTDLTMLVHLLARTPPRLLLSYHWHRARPVSQRLSLPSSPATLLRLMERL